MWCMLPTIFGFVNFSCTLDFLLCLGLTPSHIHLNWMIVWNRELWNLFGGNLWYDGNGWFGCIHDTNCVCYRLRRLRWRLRWRLRRGLRWRLRRGLRWFLRRLGGHKFGLGLRISGGRCQKSSRTIMMVDVDISRRS